MNESVFSFLNYYASSPNPQYAVMLRGNWGSGKTFFIQRWLKSFEQKSNQPADENGIELKPIYISLFGMGRIVEIKNALDRKLNPFFYSKTGKTLKTVWRFASKIAFKTELDLNGDEKEETSFSGTLDSLSVFEGEREEIKGVKFIIFDDLERCQIPVKQLLGFINYMVEHCDCKVVIIGEENRMLEETQKAFNDFKEKVVGREFLILPDIKSAITDFIAQPGMMIDFLKLEESIIVECFECTQKNNLRLLRQALMDFSSLLEKLPILIVNKNISYLRALLCTYIAVYAEYRNNDSRDLFRDWTNKYSNAHFIREENEENIKVRQVLRKYASLDSVNMFEVLNPSLVPMVVESIETGKSFSDKIVAILEQQDKKQSALERLDSYWDKSNEEFEEIYALLINELKDRSICEPLDIGKAIAFLGYFDNSGIKVLTNNVFESLKSISLIPLERCKTLQSLYACKAHFMQGYLFVRNSAKEEFKTKDVIVKFESRFEELKTMLPDEMQSVLRKLCDSNVNDLMEVDSHSYPDHSSNYRMRPIFEYENPELLCTSLCQMSNKGRNTFCQFLAYHYEFHANCGFADVYKPDHDVLVDLKCMIIENSKEAIELDRLSYDYLIEALNKAIKRCAGEKIVE